jgi:hypothetical protein
MPEDKIIEDDRAMPSDLQLAHTMTADVTGSSNNQNIHVWQDNQRNFLVEAKINLPTCREFSRLQD